MAFVVRGAALVLVSCSLLVAASCVGPRDSILVLENRTERTVVLFEASHITDQLVEPNGKHRLAIYEFDGEITWSLREIGGTEDIVSVTTTFDEMKEAGGVTLTVD